MYRLIFCMFFACDMCVVSFCTNIFHIMFLLMYTSVSSVSNYDLIDASVESGLG